MLSYDRRKAAGIFSKGGIIHEFVYHDSFGGADYHSVRNQLENQNGKGRRETTEH